MISAKLKARAPGGSFDRDTLETALVRDFHLNMSKDDVDAAFRAMGGSRAKSRSVGHKAFKQWFAQDEITMHLVALTKGAYFGELSLLYDAPRQATVIAETEGRLWTIDIKDFKHIVVQGNSAKSAGARAILAIVCALLS